jgi:hypothetical protein
MRTGSSVREEGEEQREEADEEAESEGGELVEVQQKVPAKSEAKEPTERGRLLGLDNVHALLAEHREDILDLCSELTSFDSELIWSWVT